MELKLNWFLVLFLITEGLANVLRSLYGMYINLFVFKPGNVFEIICCSKIKAFQNALNWNYSIFKQWSKFLPDIIIGKPHKDSIKKPVLYEANTVATLTLIGHKQNLLLKGYHSDYKFLGSFSWHLFGISKFVK